VKLRRVWIVYRKELLEALRDRRTLIAMVLVPLLLYPVLMIVVAQALQIEKARREREIYRIVVPTEGLRRWLAAVVAADESAGDTSQPATTQTGRRATVAGHQFDIEATSEPLAAAVRGGSVQLGVSVEPEVPERSLGDEKNRVVRVFYDPSEYRSEIAMRSIQGILARQTGRLVALRLEKAGLQDDVLRPLDMDITSVASPTKLGGALLGQILPFLLVIMTVTGAIYPAIDLTAGEREHGTLETLMSAPVPRTQVMAGKFLVVATVAITSSALNLVSMGATMRFSGVAEAMTRAMPGAGPVSIPTAVLPVVLLAMVPFAVLFSAVMLATCSLARSFKEAQNYMTPVMIAALIPAMVISYMPSVKLAGPVMVMPVANVVVLLRELFAGRYDAIGIGMTFGSTCLYAAAAVLGAAKLYGQEAVLFSDVGSYRTLFSRRFLRPAARPTAAGALLLAAVIFPLSFYWQTAVATPNMSPGRLAAMTISLMLGCYLLPPLLAAWYAKLDMRETFSLRWPGGWTVAGTILVAATCPMVAVAMSHWITRALPQSEEMARLMGEQEARLLGLPTWLLVLTIAVLPAICEEVMFRGFLLAGLRQRMPAAAACLVVGLIFGLFHADLWRIPTTAALGFVLTWVCLRGGSIYAAMLIHLVNNSAAVLSGKSDWLAQYLGTGEGHSVGVLCAAVFVLLVGMWLVRGGAGNATAHEKGRVRPGL